MANIQSQINVTTYLVEKFESPVRVLFYCVSFVLLSMHLLHGFSSSLKLWDKSSPFLKDIDNKFINNFIKRGGWWILDTTTKITNNNKRHEIWKI